MLEREITAAIDADAAPAARLGDYFALQLRLVDAMAERTGRPRGALALHLTNLHRRFGLGDAGEGAPCAAWTAYADRLDRLASPAARLAWTLETLARSAPEPATKPVFGCFSFDPPDAEGAIRIHFSNRDGDADPGPLSRERRPRRLADLRAMFAFLAEAHREARTVRGGSWLYNLEAYRRLFPPQFGASRSLPERVRLNGTSSWGQLLDHKAQVKPAVRDAFLRNLEDLDPQAPWRVFPLPALRTEAPIALFAPFYEQAAI